MLEQKATGLKPLVTTVSSQGGESVLQFDAAGVVRGIVYHLMDENLAKSISTETIRRTLDRLVAKCFNSSIPRSRWLGMSNSQRLEWLLAESQTITLVGDDDVVFLRNRRVR